MQHEVGELLDEAIWSDMAQLTWLEPSRLKFCGAQIMLDMFLQRIRPIRLGGSLF